MKIDLKKTISVIGSTGSIGTQTLNVAAHLGFSVAALAAGSNITLLEEQARRFCPDVVAVFDEKKAIELKRKLKDTNIRVLEGKEGVCQAAAIDGADMTVAAAVGIAGLAPVMAAIEAKKDVAFANKEVLAAAGSVVMPFAKAQGVRMLPVDSEHSAVFQSMQGSQPHEVKKIILTASGGPFFGYTKEQLKKVTVEQALKHPNWSMGGKITIDCATMMNKGLEVIEAMWLFDQPIENIEILIHRESIIHSLVEFVDHSVLAQLGSPDMRTAIQYALTYPNRMEGLAKPLNLLETGKMTFFQPDVNTFSCLDACLQAAKIGKTMPSAVNGGNEAAVAAFFEGQISFAQIGELALSVLKNHKSIPNPTLDDIIAADLWAREFVAALI